MHFKSLLPILSVNFTGPILINRGPMCPPAGLQWSAGQTHGSAPTKTIELIRGNPNIIHSLNSERERTSVYPMGTQSA